ncbi:hypothetical protein T492DRAFT_989972 [Pavlovales sp. CCMP2436]|nr:hypothetical protein T492DRAFT_989972 [Pavlovales sp. CCMP2436]
MVWSGAGAVRPQQLSSIGQSRVPLVTRSAPAMAWNLAEGRQALAGAALAFTIATGSAQATVVPTFAPPSLTVGIVGLDSAEDELRPAQKKFLDDRKSNPQETQYEKQVKGTFKDKEATETGKFKYTTVVVGLLLIAFVAPMAQFFYYVKEDDE